MRPNTSSGLPYVKIVGAGDDTTPKVDMTTIVPSTVISIKSRDCSACAD